MNDINGRWYQYSTLPPSAWHTLPITETQPGYYMWYLTDDPVFIVSNDDIVKKPVVLLFYLLCIDRVDEASDIVKPLLVLLSNQWLKWR